MSIHCQPNFDVKPEDSIAMLYHVIIWVEHWAEVHFGMFNPCWADTFISRGWILSTQQEMTLPFFTARTFQVKGQRSVNMLDHSMNMIEGSLEVKLPTIWTVEKQSRGRGREKMRRERVRRKKIQMREKVGKSRTLCFSNDLWLRRVEKYS